MANRTLKGSKNIHGQDPQHLVEKIIRTRIYDSNYWKENCFDLTAELMIDKAIELKYIGGVYGANIKPTPFICLILKLLQIQPEKDIIIEFIKNEDFKYIRALGAFYLRLTAPAIECYKYLEPLYNDYRKLRRQNRMGHYEIVYMDEFIDELLIKDRVCDVILPRIQKRQVLEENGELEQRVTTLNDLNESENEQQGNKSRRRSSSSEDETRRSHIRHQRDSPLRKKYRKEKYERDRERQRPRSNERK
ncbi:hypothetical protein PVAND_004846 [Polypedilum vanderplanki]|uniref:Pre-mRNA-splicing factor 38 n=1 Tax=Polypedilum vanderplanki TaxID=319348 RepID=A0A9J6BZB2_POLVA|nr:hypothetical protein PVAND_004846 [Polypedilum vanderplanki]